MKNGVVVGRLPTPAGEDIERFGVVLEHASPLTDCVSHTIEVMTQDGTLH